MIAESNAYMNRNAGPVLRGEIVFETQNRCPEFDTCNAKLQIVDGRTFCFLHGWMTAVETTSLACAPIQDGINFIPTTIGVNSLTNLIDQKSRVQVYEDASGNYRVAVPASVRNGGLRTVAASPTLKGAIALTAPIVEKQFAKMGRLQATALKMNNAR